MNQNVLALAGERSDTINHVALKPHAAASDDAGKLMLDGLLFLKPNEPVDHVKVILVLQPTAVLVDAAAITRLLVNAFRGIDGLPVLSVYGGAGDLGRFVIRLTVPSFEQLTSLIHRVDELLDVLPVRTMYFPLVELIGSESDNLNNAFGLDSSEHRFVDDLGVTIDTFELLSRHSRERAMEIFSFVKNNLDSPEPFRNWPTCAARCNRWQSISSEGESLLYARL